MYTKMLVYEMAYQTMKHSRAAISSCRCAAVHSTTPCFDTSWAVCRPACHLLCCCPHQPCSNDCTCCIHHVCHAVTACRTVHSRLSACMHLCGQGRLEGVLLYTPAYMRNIRAQLRGALRAHMSPVAIPSILKVCVAHPLLVVDTAPHCLIGMMQQKHYRTAGTCKGRCLLWSQHNAPGFTPGSIPCL
jgi:hypothetical protein